MSGMCFFWRFWAPQAAQHTRTLLGDFKTEERYKIEQQQIKINETNRVRTPKSQGRVFSEGSGRRRQRNTHTPCWETLKPQQNNKIGFKSTKINKTHKVHAPKIEGVFFLRVLKRRRQRNTHAPCWETLRPTQRYQNRATNNKTHKAHAPKIQGVFFWGF